MDDFVFETDSLVYSTVENAVCNHIGWNYSDNSQMPISFIPEKYESVSMHSDRLKKTVCFKVLYCKGKIKKYTVYISNIRLI